MFFNEHSEAKIHLPKIIEAHRPRCLSARCAQRGQKERGENSNDSNHNEQFNQRESGPFLIAARFHVRFSSSRV